MDEKIISIDETSINKIIINDEKEIDRGHSLRKRGREKYDIEFNKACMIANFNEVKRLVNEENCDGYAEGLIGLCSSDYKDQKDIKETVEYLLDKHSKTSSRNIVKKLVPIASEHNVKALESIVVFTSFDYKDWKNMLDEIDKITIDSYKYIINSLSKLGIDKTEQKEDFKEIEKIHKLINKYADKARRISYENRDEKLFEATLEILPEIKLIINDNSVLNVVESGLYLPVKMGLEKNKNNKDIYDILINDITYGGNLETFKRIVEENNFSMIDKGEMWLQKCL